MLIFFRRIKRMRSKGARNKQGKAFESMTSNALRRLVSESNGKMWFHRLYDYKTFIAINPNLVCIKQPGDYIAVSNGNFYLLECKSSTLDRYVLENVKPHQEEAMSLIERAGGFYWLLLFHRHKADTAHEFYVLSPRSWRALKALTRKEGYASASWVNVRKCAEFTLKRVGGVWDMHAIFMHNAQKLASPLQRMRKRFIVRGRKRDTRFILAREFPAVAIYDSETESIYIITDIWVNKCVEAWRTYKKCESKACRKCLNRTDACRKRVCALCDNKNFANCANADVCIAGFISYISADMLISQMHELEHWATEPITLTGVELTLFEELVEKTAEQLIKNGRTSACVSFTLGDNGGLTLD